MPSAPSSSYATFSESCRIFQASLVITPSMRKQFSRVNLAKLLGNILSDTTTATPAADGKSKTESKTKEKICAVKKKSLHMLKMKSL